MNAGLASVVRSIKDGLRAQLWPLPTVAIVFAVAVGVILPKVDAAVDKHLPPWLTSLIFGGDGQAASTVLDAVSSSLITVTSLTFSLTVVTLQLASSQYSPRLLRTFTQDMFVQGTLALFLGTFAYALTVLRTVRSSNDDGQSAFVPRIAVTSGYLLAVISVIGLVLFLAHLTRQIRVETMLDAVREDAGGTIATVLKPRGEGNPVTGTPLGTGQPILGRNSGFLLGTDTKDLLKASKQAGATIEITVLPGDFVVEGVPVGAAHGLDGALSPEVLTDLGESVGKALRLGPERTASQDVGFALRQLTDVAAKALSPGVNDPTTAVHSLDHISVLLCQLSECELGPVEYFGDGGDDDDADAEASDPSRVVLNRPDLEHLVEMSLTQLRRYGSSDPLVTARLYQLLDELAWHVAPSELQLVERERERLDATVAASDFDEVTRRLLAASSSRVGRLQTPTTEPVDERPR